jgi:hypothetical protein
VLQETGEHEISEPRRRNPIEFTRLRARKCHEFAQRVDLERHRNRDGGEYFASRRDRHEIARIVGQLLVDDGIDRDRVGCRIQQRVIVARGSECASGEDAVGARLVLDHDRLAPALRQPVAEQSRGGIGRAAGPERHHELHGALRPVLRLRLHVRYPDGGQQRHNKRMVQVLARHDRLHLLCELGLRRRISA